MMIFNADDLLGASVHTEAYQFVQSIAECLPQEDYRTVVDFGSKDVNGSVRPLFPKVHYHGIDMLAGKGVDEVANAAFWKPPASWLVNVIVSCEMMEHCMDAPRVCQNAYEILAPGGMFILTAANELRQAHSVHGTLDWQQEYYCPVRSDMLSWWLRPFHFVQIRNREQDVYALAIKKRI